MWLDRAIKWLLPREERFYDLLERGADLAKQSADMLVACAEAKTIAEREVLVSRLVSIEHDADGVIHEVYDALNRTFVTPLDRSDIYALATALEDVADIIQATSSLIVVHSMETLPEGSLEISKLIQDACNEIVMGVKLLRSLKDPNAIRACCKRLNDLESAGDKVYRARIGEMFRTERDAIRLMKNKEYLEGLEHALDICDDVANSLETIIIKNA